MVYNPGIPQGLQEVFLTRVYLRVYKGVPNPGIPQGVHSVTYPGIPQGVHQVLHTRVYQGVHRCYIPGYTLGRKRPLRSVNPLFLREEEASAQC